MNPSLEILSQGEEVVTGQIADTNAAWLSQQSVILGFNIFRHTAVGDKLEDLVQILSEIAERADACICTGGLGPTSDDLTAEAAAQAFDAPLAFDEIAYRQIRDYFQKRQRRMADCNRKQAMLPARAVRLDNHWGTAPGFSLQAGRCRFWFLPGVPSEMRQFFTAYVQPMMARQFNLNPGRLVTLKTAGIGESDLQERISAINIPPDVQLGFRAQLGEVQTKLLFPASYPLQQLEALADSVANAIGDFVFAIEGLSPTTSADLAAVVSQLMAVADKKLLLIETASRGLVSAKINGEPWLTSAFYYQSAEMVRSAFNMKTVCADLMEESKALAFAVREQTGEQMILIQLCHDTDESNQDEKNTKVVNVLLDGAVCHQADKLIAGDATRRQQLSAVFTLDFLRRVLQGKNLRG